MLRRLLILLCLALGTIALAKTPRPLTDTMIPAPDHKDINLRKYRGKVVLAVVFSPECADCMAVMSAMNKLQKDYGSRGFQVVAAIAQKDAAAAVQPYVDRYRPTFPVGYFDQKDLIKFADISADTRPFVPIFLFIDHTGTVRFQYYGNDPFMKDWQRATRAIISGLIRQRDQHQAPVRVHAPAPTQK